MTRWLPVAVVLGSLLCGCARPELPEIIVQAPTPGEFDKFRAELGADFSLERLQPFDTAIQELKLEAMRQGVAGVAAREQQVATAIHGKTVHATQILGWQARRGRLQDERAEITKLLERDRRLLKGATGAARSIADRIRSEEEILARIDGDLADTERQLIDWGAPPATERRPVPATKP